MAPPLTSSRWRRRCAFWSPTPFIPSKPSLWRVNPSKGLVHWGEPLRIERSDSHYSNVYKCDKILDLNKMCHSQNHLLHSHRLLMIGYIFYAETRWSYRNIILLYCVNISIILSVLIALLWLGWLESSSHLLVLCRSRSPLSTQFFSVSSLLSHHINGNTNILIY